MGKLEKQGTGNGMGMGMGNGNGNLYKKGRDNSELLVIVFTHRTKDD